MMMSVVLVMGVQMALAQQATWQTIGAGGTALAGENRFSAQSSAGQAGPIGSFSASGLLVRQGFIQPRMRGAFGQVPTELDMIIYPNPTAGIINIQINETISGQVHVLILDLTGRHQDTQTFQPAHLINLSMADLPVGMYLVRVATDHKSKIVRIIKQ